MNKIIITGISGFIGTNLNDFFQNNDETTLGVSRNPGNNQVDYLNLNLSSFNESKAIIHLAGKAHDLKKTTEDKEYFDVNCGLTIKLFDQFLESTCETFIYMSSVKAAADSVKGVLTENKIPNPITIYGKSKLAAEKYILSKNIPESKKVYILRPCMVHGPGNKGNLNLLYNVVSKGIPYPLGSFKNKRSFLSIQNLCFMIGQLLIIKPVSGLYNVADDQSISTNQLIKLIGIGCGKKSKILYLPRFLIVVLSKFGSLFHLPMNSERLQKLTESYLVSNTKIKEVINKPLPLTCEQGLLKTFKSF
jgi:nucleoside-diphosphate-sugar epimerase